jgi:hypothetical protein
VEPTDVSEAGATLPEREIFHKRFFHLFQKRCFSARRQTDVI